MPAVAESTLPVSAKLPADVLDSARIVSSYQHKPMFQLLGDILRPILASLERAEIAKRSSLNPVERPS